jgi:hypothetical protein
LNEKVHFEGVILQVKSTVTREVQKIQMVVAPVVGSFVNEIQAVVVQESSGTFSDATFRLGLYGVYTGE